MTTVWIYIDTNKEVGDPDHLKVFASADAAGTNGSRTTIPKAFAFEYVVIGDGERRLKRDE